MIRSREGENLSAENYLQFVISFIQAVIAVCGALLRAVSAASVGGCVNLEPLYFGVELIYYYYYSSLSQNNLFLGISKPVSCDLLLRDGLCVFVYWQLCGWRRRSVPVVPVISTPK